MRWERARFLTDPVDAARALIGAVLVHETPHGTTAGRITETEAYGGSFEGQIDDSFHAYKGKTVRTEVLFGEGGHAYVYLIYGMYCCMNVVTGPAGTPSGVLLRSLEPLDGQELMAARRGGKQGNLLTAGPGRLCMAMGIDRENNGDDLVKGQLYIEDRGDGPFSLDVSRRINVDYAEKGKHFPWRFTLRGSQWVSK